MPWTGSILGDKYSCPLYFIDVEADETHRQLAQVIQLINRRFRTELVFLTLCCTVHSTLLRLFLSSFTTLSKVSSLRSISFSHTQSSIYEEQSKLKLCNYSSNYPPQLAIIIVTIYLAYSMCHALC